MKNRVQKRKRSAGFTLLEVAVAVAVVSLGLPAIAYLYASSMTVGSDAKLSEQAFFLANSLMNEISEKRFREDAANPGNGADTGEVSGYDRRAFDDIDDYDIFSTTWADLTPPLDLTGAAIPNSSQFSQYVEVVNVPPPTGAARDLDAVADGSTSFKKVTVRISWDAGRRFKTISKIFALP